MKWRQSNVCLRPRLFEMVNEGERADSSGADRPALLLVEVWILLFIYLFVFSL